MGSLEAFLNFFCLSCGQEQSFIWIAMFALKKKLHTKLYFLIIKFKVYSKLLIRTVVKLPVVVIFECLLFIYWNKCSLNEQEGFKSQPIQKNPLWLGTYPGTQRNRKLAGSYFGAGDPKFKFWLTRGMLANRKHDKEQG